MFLIKDPKQTAATLVVSIGKEEDHSEEENGTLVAAEEILKAVESKDAKLLAIALQSFVSMCEHEDEEEEGSSQDGMDY